MTSDIRIYKNVIASPAKESWSSHHFVTGVGPEDWSNKSIFVNWELISQDLKDLGLVDSVYQESGASRDDALTYLSIHGGEELRQKIQEVLDDYA